MKIRTKHFSPLSSAEDSHDTKTNAKSINNLKIKKEPRNFELEAEGGVQEFR